LNPFLGGGYLAGARVSEVRLATKPNFFTADEVQKLPVPGDALGYELVDGQPVLVMPASLLHGRLIVEVAYRLEKHVREHGLPGSVFSDAGVVLGLRRDPERLRGPDVMYVERTKLEGHDPERVFRGIPDLAVEIDLTSAKKPGGQQRILDYLEAGVRLVWAIEPQTRTAMVYMPDGSARLLRDEDVLDGEDVVPGFGLPLSELFID
jgi:Uma2 family endonuclease